MDKLKTCKDCPDRQIDPNCHSTCAGYLERKRKTEEARKARFEYSEELSDRMRSMKRCGAITASFDR